MIALHPVPQSADIAGFTATPAMGTRCIRDAPVISDEKALRIHHPRTRPRASAQFVMQVVDVCRDPIGGNRGGAASVLSLHGHPGPCGGVDQVGVT